ncbi:MAG: DUF4406 domain-containing protein [Dysgonamonadaceae bacterium]|jgi:hypothetical protein|nr:DUF4406 domain-containing protein [Dysgonamonadaceae bacterium]
MKKSIYISGKITGEPFEKVKERFQKAEDFLKKTGFEVVNPTKNGLTASHKWEQHLLRDIETLFSCDAIYMLNGWADSTGSRIEHNIALETGKEIIFEAGKGNIDRIERAIREVTGMELSEYATGSRKTPYVYARQIFAYHCRQAGMEWSQIAERINRDRTTVLYSVKMYGDELKFNPKFRRIANRVVIALSQEETHQGSN